VEITRNLYFANPLVPGIPILGTVVIIRLVCARAYIQYFYSLLNFGELGVIGLCLVVWLPLGRFIFVLRSEAELFR